MARDCQSRRLSHDRREIGPPLPGRRYAGRSADRGDHELDWARRSGPALGSAALLKRPEAGRTGIYVLLGDDPNSLGGTIAYIGEGDDVSKRLYQHARPEDQGGKDFWDRAIVLTSKDTNLTKAHARYLESRLITLAQQANRARLVNGTAPPPLPLPEADISDMEYFIAQAKIVLPVLGVNLFVPRRRSYTSSMAQAWRRPSGPVPYV